MNSENESNLDDFVVKKPWGEEFLIYRNKNLAMWFLKIEKDQKTSMHCHPKKNTGLILLDGMAKISFLNNSITLKGLDKVMIFKGRFHSTAAISHSGAFILEIESPEDKFDLIRFKDSYGRKNKKYEGKENYYKKTDNHPFLSQDKKTEIANCIIEIKKNLQKKDIDELDFEDVLVFLEGNLYCEQNPNPISSIGDVISASNLQLLLEEFKLSDDACLMIIRRKKYNVYI
jgi:quercetin dioxygenase-like cupin family protein